MKTNSAKNIKLVEDGKKAIDSAISIIQKTKVIESAWWRLRKLATGIFMFSFAAFFCTQYRGYQKTHIDNYIINNWLSFVDKDFAKGLIGFIGWILAGVAILWVVRGINKASTFSFYVEDIDNPEPILSQLKRAILEPSTSYSNSRYNNIETLISYRDSKLATLTYEQKADLMRHTAFLDAAKSGVYTGKNAKEAISYMNSKLGAKTFEGGLDYISGK